MPIATVSAAIGRIWRHRRCVASDTMTTTLGPPAVVANPLARVTMTAIATGQRRRNAIRTRQTRPTAMSPMTHSGLASHVSSHAPTMAIVLMDTAAA